MTIPFLVTVFLPVTLAFLICIVFFGLLVSFIFSTQVSKVYLVGISGKIGSGKSTLAKNLNLIDKRLKVFECSFGDALKRAVADEYEFDVALCYSQEGKNTVPNEKCNNKTVGQLLQQFGTMKRESNENVWVEAVQEFIAERSTDDYKNMLAKEGFDKIMFIVPDVRFPNETAWINNDGGVLIRLDGDPKGVFDATTRDKNHISETALDDYKDFDLIIDTNVNDEDDCVILALDVIFN